MNHADKINRANLLADQTARDLTEGHPDDIHAEPPEYRPAPATASHPADRQLRFSVAMTVILIVAFIAIQSTGGGHPLLGLDVTLGAILLAVDVAVWAVRRAS